MRIGETVGSWCALSCVALVASCADPMPRPDDTVALQVNDVLTVEQWHRGRQIDVANALAQGVSEADIEAGRLVLLICALPPEAQNPEVRWVVLLPEGLTLMEGDVVSFQPGTRYGVEGPLGSFTGRLPPPAPETLHVWKYGKSVRCGAPTHGVSLQARFGFAFGRNDLREYQLHRQRMRAISEDEVRAGHIVRASCSRLSEGWTEWTVRVPSGLGIEKGDHILAHVGTPDDQLGSALSEAIKKIPAPSAEQTYPVQGSRIIRCNAVAVDP